MSLPKARWHPRYEECKGCGRADRPHIARGYCESCYRKARATERRQLDEQEGPARVSTLRRGWHHTHAACAGCGTTTRPHLRDGLCVDCYRGRHGLGELGREDVPVYQVERRAPTPIMGRQAQTLQGQLDPEETPVAASAGEIAQPEPAGQIEQLDHRPEAWDAGAPVPTVGDHALDRVTGVEPAPAGAARPGDRAQARKAPRLFARHIRIVRTYVITCPNCGETVRNGRTGEALFRDEDLPAGTEVDCDSCGAWWEINIAAESATGHEPGC